MDLWDRSYSDTGFVRLLDPHQELIVYKFTNRNGVSHNDTVWKPGGSHKAPGCEQVDYYGVVDPCPPLCTKYWLHAYPNPVLAELLSPVHLDEPDGVLWKCEAIARVVSLDQVVGCTYIKTLEKIDRPVISVMTRALWAVSVVAKLSHYMNDRGFAMWLSNWISSYERELSVDTRMIDFLSGRFRELSKKGKMTPLAWCYYASYWAVQAARYSIFKMDRLLVSNMVALAAANAAIAAFHIGIKDFDLLSVAEDVMMA